MSKFPFKSKVKNISVKIKIRNIQVVSVARFEIRRLLVFNINRAHTEARGKKQVNVEAWAA